MAARTDEDLVGAARRGDQRALGTLLHRQQGRVFRFSLKMCGDEEQAKDVAQETLFAVARTVRHFRRSASLSTWLYTIARSFCIKQRRRRKGEPEPHATIDVHEAAELGHLPAGAGSPEEAVANHQLAETLDRALAALEPKYREVLLLRDVEGLSAKEVAEVVGINVAAVKSRLHRARATVRTTLAPALGIAEPPAADGCPDVLAMVSQHIEGELSAAVCAKMEAHVQQCPRCEARCASLRRTLSLCRASPTPRVPPEVQEAVRRAVRELGARPR
jgi:RNA polymerase sigma-70 factor (ECF subfamily)